MTPLMSFLRRFVEAFTRYRSEEPLPSERTEGEYDAPTVDVTVYSSPALLDNNGRVSERVAIKFIAHALDDAGLNYDLRAGHDPVEPPVEKVIGQVPGWWRDREVVDESPHCNLLLVNAPGGGRTYDPWSVAGAQYLTDDLDLADHMRGIRGGELSAILHELGWCIGSVPDADDDEPGKQHTGVGWNESGEWYRTPMQIDPDVHNACDEKIPPREHDDVVQVLTFSQCSKQWFRDWLQEN